MIKLVTFDYNGTIVDDTKMMYACTVVTIIKFAASGPYEKLKFENWRKEFDLPYDDFYQLFGLRVDKNFHDEFHQLYNSFKMPRLFPYFKRALAEIQKTGIKTAVISGITNEKAFYAVLKKKKIMFDKIYLSSKDKVAAFKKAAEDFNIQTNEICYVCDMKYDIRASREASAISIFYLKGVNGKYGLYEKANHYFNNYRDLPDIIKSILL